MKIKSIVGTAMGGLLLLASNASAYNRSGSECQPGAGANAIYDGTAVNNQSAFAGTMVCPLDAQANLGTTVQWSWRVNNTSTSDVISCTGFSFNSDGVQVTSTPLASTSGTGPQTIAKSVTFQTQPTHSHASNCHMPAQPLGGQASQILRYELF
jgi:hypothetical protein